MGYLLKRTNSCHFHSLSFRIPQDTLPYTRNREKKKKDQHVSRNIMRTVGKKSDGTQNPTLEIKTKVISLFFKNYYGCSTKQNKPQQRLLE